MVVQSEAGREVRIMRWGLVPYWAKPGFTAYSTINARCESVATKPAFREPFRKRRCLIPASGFYEWRPEGKIKQPYYITLRGQPMTFGGLWDRWRGPAGTVETYSIVTTAAAPEIAHLHDRMPLLLPENAWGIWLNPEAPLEVVADLMRPWDGGGLDFHPVSRMVNNPRHDLPSLTAPAGG